MILRVAALANLALLAARLLLAGVFLLAGSTKLVDPAGSLKALRGFGLPQVLARPMVLLLPVLELLVAMALIPESLAWYGACGALALLTVFLIVLAIAILRGRKPDCHCFGQLHSAPVDYRALLRNAVLAACAAWLVSRGPANPGTDIWAWLLSLGDQELKIAWVVGCVGAFLFYRLVNRARPRSEPVETAPADSAPEENDEEPAPVSASVRRPAPAPKESPVQPPAAPRLPLPIGTLAPEFELECLAGETRSLQSLRKQGRDVLLVFASPFCKPCMSTASNLVLWSRALHGLPNIVLISRGAAKDNLPKLRDFGPSRVLLQRNFEVAEAYGCESTPAAVLVGADGLIRSDLAIGGDAIKELLTSSARQGNVDVATHPVRNMAAPL